MTKLCHKCKTQKQSINFAKQTSRKDGLQPLWATDNFKKGKKVSYV